MKTSSGCIGCVTGEKASPSVNFVLENKSRKYFRKKMKSSKNIMKILTSGENLWYLDNN